MNHPDCKARRVCDQMQCPRCGTAWDVDDPDPPPCRNVGHETLERIKQQLKEKSND